MNWTRVFTGFFVFLATITFVILGGFVFSLLVSVVAVVALWEFYKLVIPDIVSFSGIFLYFIGFFNAAALVLVTHFYGLMHVPIILSVNLFLVAFITLIVFKKDSYIPIVAIKQVAGLIYIPLSLSFLVVIRNSVSGLSWSLMILCIVSSGDIGAYYFGRLLGLHKLSPHISPKKTIEGSLAGLLCNIVVAIAFKILAFPFFTLGYCCLFACLLGVSAQIGDLFASEFKRVAGVKDFGKVLPGHGGFLDRIDAMLLALPVAYIFCYFIV